MGFASSRRADGLKAVSLGWLQRLWDLDAGRLALIADVGETLYRTQAHTASTQQVALRTKSHRIAHFGKWR